MVMLVKRMKNHILLAYYKTEDPLQHKIDMKQCYESPTSFVVLPPPHFAP